MQRLSFGGKVSTQTFGTSAIQPKRINLMRLEEDLSAAHLRLHGVVIECLPWQQCIARYDRSETLFFLDPPYWQTEGYGLDFGWEQYEQLAETMATLRGKAVLTINDHPDIRRLLDPHFRGTTVDISYTIGGTRAPRRERIYVTTPGV